eukprot:6896383-Prymnesium_polylepis.2
MLPKSSPGDADTWTRTDRGWSEYCQPGAPAPVAGDTQMPVQQNVPPAAGAWLPPLGTVGGGGAGVSPAAGVVASATNFVSIAAMQVQHAQQHQLQQMVQAAIAQASASAPAAEAAPQAIIQDTARPCARIARGKASTWVGPAGAFSILTCVRAVANVGTRPSRQIR